MKAIIYYFAAKEYGRKKFEEKEDRRFVIFFYEGS